VLNRNLRRRNLIRGREVLGELTERERTAPSTSGVSIRSRELRTRADGVERFSSRKEPDAVRLGDVRCRFASRRG